MDGAERTTWNTSSRLNVNTGAIEMGSRHFGGTLNLTTGSAGRLTLNLADPNASWTMAGRMNLAGLGNLTITRVAGSRMIVIGDFNMGAGIAQITADTALQGADVSIAANGTPRFFGGTTVDAAATFAGTGTLHNGIGAASAGRAMKSAARSTIGIHLRSGCIADNARAEEMASTMAGRAWRKDGGSEALGANDC